MTAEIVKSSSPQGAPNPPAALPRARRVSHAVRVLMLIAVLLIAAVGIIGWFHLRREEAAMREAAYEMLTAVADLKVSQIARWRKERLADAIYLRRTPYAARRALDALVDESERTRQMFTSWLHTIVTSEPYVRALLLDTQMNIRLVHPPKASQAFGDDIRAGAETALRTREVTVTDLHREPDGGQIHLDYLVPLVVRREGTRDNVPAAGQPASTNDRSAGVLVLEVSATEFLFPLIEQWPAPSLTAETLLVRREGDGVLFINNLRHRPGAALSLRLPDTQPGLPAALAVSGQVGTVEGVDYRGVGVLAAMRPVPDTPWFIVAKVDQSEIYAPLRQQSLMTALLVGLVVMAAILGVGLVWRQEALAASRREFAERRQADEARLRERILLRTVIDHIPDPIYVKDPHGAKTLANRAEIKWLGLRTEAEVLGKTDTDMYPPEIATGSEQNDREVLESGVPILDREEPVKDGQGRLHWVVTSKLPLRNEAGAIVGLVGISHDITARKAAEAALRESEERFRLMVEGSESVFFYSHDAAHRFTYLSPSVQAVLGYAPAELLGQPYDVLLTDETGNAIVHDETGRALKDGQRRPPYLAAVRHQDGRRLVLEIVETPITRDGQEIGIHGFARDVTERKEAEESLARQTRELRARNEELTRFNRAAVGRELRMVALKQEVNELCGRLTEPPRYNAAADAPANDE